MNRTLKQDIEKHFDEIDDTPEKVNFKINENNIKFFYSSVKILTKNTEIEEIINIYQLNFCKDISGKNYEIKEEGFTIDDVKLFLEDLSQKPISITLDRTNHTLILKCFNILVDLKADNFIEKFIVFENNRSNSIQNDKQFNTNVILEVAKNFDNLSKMYIIPENKDIDEIEIRKKSSLEEIVSKSIIINFLNPLLKKEYISDEEVEESILYKELKNLYELFILSTNPENSDQSKLFMSKVNKFIIDEIIKVKEIINSKENLCKIIIQYTDWLTESEICINMVKSFLYNQNNNEVDQVFNSNFLDSNNINSNNLEISQNLIESKFEDLVTSKIDNLINNISIKEKSFSNVINEKLNEINQSYIEENKLLNSKIENLERKIETLGINNEDSIFKEFMIKNSEESLAIDCHIEDLKKRNQALEEKNNTLEKKIDEFEKKILNMSEILSKKIQENEVNIKNPCNKCKKELIWCKAGDANSKAVYSCPNDAHFHNNYYRFYCTSCNYAFCTLCAYPKGEKCGCNKKLISQNAPNHMCDICRGFLNNNVVYYRCQDCDYDSCSNCILKCINK